VARYYIDVLDGGALFRDDVGTGFDSLDDAVQGAVLSVGEISKNKLVKGDTSDIVVQLRDERNQHVCTITASMKIDRHGSPRQSARPST
jgi:hypothetical protein